MGTTYSEKLGRTVSDEEYERLGLGKQATYSRELGRTLSDDEYARLAPGNGPEDEDDGGGRGGRGGRSDRGVDLTRNPQLDELMTQMIANQKVETDRRAREADERATWRNQVRGNIMDRYGKASEPVNENDPVIARARQVHDAASQRAFNTGREAMAARNVSTGGAPAGASDAYLQSSSENLAKDNSAYSSSLMMGEQDKRRQEISQLLQLGAGVLTADENRMLQEQMGTIDAEMRQLGMSSNAFLGGQGLQNQRDLGFAGLDLGRYGIDTQNRQFYDQMGNNNGIQEALMNQMIMQQLLGDV